VPRQSSSMFHRHPWCGFLTRQCLDEKRFSSTTNGCSCLLPAKQPIVKNIPLGTVKNSSITTKHLYLILTFRSHHEMFIRRSWYSVFPSLYATISCRIKKVVVGVTQLITALISIHSSVTFLADMYSFLDPPGRTVLFSVDDHSLLPVNCVIGLIHMVGDG